jgi:hypothetical protein
MGWCSGSDVAAQVWDAVRTLIPAGREKVVAARRIIKVVENFDCDTITEAKQLCADAGYVYDEQKDEHVYTPLPADAGKANPEREHCLAMGGEILSGVE